MELFVKLDFLHGEPLVRFLGEGGRSLIDFFGDNGTF